MNAIEMLKDDHKKVRTLFREYERTSDMTEREAIAEDAFIELEIHSRLEEEIFYPAVRERASEEGRSLVSESYDEHHAVETLIAELRQMNPGEPDFDGKFRALAREVERHVDDEESRMLPEAEQLLVDDLDRLGKAMRQRKSELAQAA